MDTRATSPGETVFRPEVFFLGRTEGGGVVRDALGRVARRCTIVTEGCVDGAYGALRLDETFTFDDGEIDIWRWAMRPGGDGRYLAAEASAGAGIEGRQDGDDYVLSFRRAIGRARGFFRPRIETRFTLISSQVALKSSRVTLFGLPIGVLTAIHQRMI